MKPLKGKFRPSYAFDEVGIYSFRLITRRPLGQVYDYLRSRFNSYCSHSYDCCGCRTYSYSVIKCSSREYFVRVSIGRNY